MAALGLTQVAMGTVWAMAAPGIPEVATGTCGPWQPQGSLRWPWAGAGNGSPCSPAVLGCSSPTWCCRGNLRLRTWDGSPCPDPRPPQAEEGLRGWLTGGVGAPARCERRQGRGAEESPATHATKTDSLTSRCPLAQERAGLLCCFPCTFSLTSSSPALNPSQRF